MTRLPDSTHIGAVELNVADVERELTFYEGLLGFTRRRERDGIVDLGIVRLRETDAAPQRAPRASGLYHQAILLPTRGDLGRVISHLIRARYPQDGASDHLVSEALYLSDPEGNGVEIYADRPRASWKWDVGSPHTPTPLDAAAPAPSKSLVMATAPMDVRSVIESGGEQPWRGMPEGTVMGHVHLQVREVAPAEAFYRDAVGFDVTTHYPSAAFLSAGGYHHHLAVNTWGTQGGPPASADALGLREYEVLVPDAAAIDAAADALKDAERIDSKTLRARDPSGNTLLLRVG